MVGRNSRLGRSGINEVGEKPLIFKITKKYDALAELKQGGFLDIDIKTNPKIIGGLKRKCKN